MKNNEEFALLSLSMDPELRNQSNNVLEGYLINREGIIKDPEGNIVTPKGYRGKPVIGVKGYMVFVDYAVAKIFLGGHKLGMYIEHIDGDLTNCHADNLRWKPRSPHQHKKHQPRQEAPKEEPQRPQGWIRRYTQDGILIREYKDIDQVVYELTYTGEVKEEHGNKIGATIRRTLKHPDHYRNYLGSRWKVSDISVLDSRAFGIHPERYANNPPTLKEFTPASETWIKRYVGPWLVQTFENIDEAVDYLVEHFSVRQQQTRQRLTEYLNGCGRDETMWGSKWTASGPEALKSVHTENKGGRPKSQPLPPLPPIDEVKTTKEETFKEIEPIEEVKPTPRKPATKQTSDGPEVDVEVIGDVTSVKVDVQRLEGSRLRVKITIGQR